MSTKVSGLLLVDKPVAWTSHDVVAFARKKLKIKEVGHCGTLDPLASGLLVLVIGEGTKLSSLVLDEDKSYEVTAQLGVVTDTLDMDGKILQTSPVNVSHEQIQSAVAALTGEVELAVPAYSAIKVGGVKLYDMARDSERTENVPTPTRRMNFFSVDFLGMEADQARFRMKCSKGSYVRSWVQVLGQRLGCGASVKALRRLRSEPYSIEHAVPLDDIEAAVANPSAAFVGLERALPEWCTYSVSGLDERLIRNGAISHQLKSRLMGSFKIGINPGAKIVDQEHRLIALLDFRQGQGFSIRRVFQH